MQVGVLQKRSENSEREELEPGAYMPLYQRVVNHREVTRQREDGGGLGS